jgi:hypothetical protein
MGKRDAALSHIPGFLPEGDRPVCRKCNRELKPVGAISDGRTYHLTGYPEKANSIRYGYDGDNYFCTLRCGYAYGLAAIRARFS